jgi:hypothetical protein
LIEEVCGVFAFDPLDDEAYERLAGAFDFLVRCGGQIEAGLIEHHANPEAVCWAAEEFEWGPKLRAISLGIMRTKLLSASRCGMRLSGVFAIGSKLRTQAGSDVEVL